MKTKCHTNGKQQFVLDRNKLQAGDIILTRGKGFASKMIRIVTRGEYSHAIICRSNKTLIEATPKGRVFSGNPQRLMFDHKDDCKVLRLTRELTEAEISKIISFLGMSIGSQYSKFEAAQVAPFNPVKKQSTNSHKQFCSRLVAKAYEQAGILLVDNVNFCAPEHLNTSLNLAVVDNALRIANDEDIAIYNKPNLILENQIETYKWLDRVITLAEQEKFSVYAQSMVAEFVIKYPKYDQEVCEYIQETNYLEHYKADEAANPARYNYISGFMPNIEEGISMAGEGIMHRGREYLKCKELFIEYGASYFQLQMLLYKNILDQITLQLQVLLQYTKADTMNNTVYLIRVFRIKKLQEHITKILST